MVFQLSKQLSSYINVNLQNSNSDTATIHAGISNILNGSNERQIDSLIQNIGTIIKKCQFCGIKSMLISDLVLATRAKFSILEETYERFELFCRNNGVILIDNRNIAGHHL